MKIIRTEEMCKVHNQIGSLTAIKAHLRAHNVHEYKSLRELINFQNSYLDARRQAILNHRSLIEQERDSLSVEIVQLKDSIHARKSEAEQRLRSEIVRLKDQLRKLPSIHANPIWTCIAYVKGIALGLRFGIKNANSIPESPMQPCWKATLSRKKSIVTNTLFRVSKTR